jgi:hypothetical protein
MRATPQRARFTTLTSTSPRYLPTTEWMPTIRFSEASALVELQLASSAGFTVGAAYQLCQLDPASPGIPTNIRPWRALGPPWSPPRTSRITSGFASGWCCSERAGVSWRRWMLG